MHRSGFLTLSNVLSPHVRVWPACLHKLLRRAGAKEAQEDCGRRRRRSRVFLLLRPVGRSVGRSIAWKAEARRVRRSYQIRTFGKPMNEVWRSVRVFKADMSMQSSSMQAAPFFPLPPLAVCRSPRALAKIRGGNRVYLSLIVAPARQMRIKAKKLS